MPQLGNSSLPLNMDDVLMQHPYITGLDSFLSEQNHLRALTYWLCEFETANLLTSASDITNSINRTIADIDELINDQLNAIIHHPKLQKLESTWRGLWMLTSQAYGAPSTKIKILDVSWPEIVKDIDRALDFDQSQLFRKIYSEEYGSPGGEPYGVLIGDYEITHRISTKHPYDDISTLRGITKIAAASFAPFITSASNEIFGLDNFSGLGQPLNLESIFSQSEYIKWHSLRTDPDSKFVGLTLPRILMRQPYRTQPGSYKGIYFHEKCSKDNKQWLWGNACYGFGVVLIREFANVGWFGHIRGTPRNQLAGGLLTTLVTDSFETDATGIATKPATDVIITDTKERELSELGFISLCQCYTTPFSTFYNNQSVHKPDRNAGVNAKLAAMLQHVLCGSRIAHYIKVIIRDKVGSFITANDCEDYLRNWLFKYTTAREDLDWEEQARYPLREAAVEVREHPEKPGQYLCVIRLRPHYQLDQMVSMLELVTELATVG